MPSVRIIQTTAAQWSLQHALHPVLRAAGAEYTPGQNQGQIHARRHCEASGCTKPVACAQCSGLVAELSIGEQHHLAKVSHEPMSWELDTCA
jgi:hypothetical protein